MQSFLF